MERVVGKGKYFQIFGKVDCAHRQLYLRLCYLRRVSSATISEFRASDLLASQAAEAMEGPRAVEGLRDGVTKIGLCTAIKVCHPPVGRQTALLSLKVDKRAGQW